MTESNQPTMANSNQTVAPPAVRRENSGSFINSEVDLQVSTAKKYPRSIGLFKQRAMEMVTLDKEIAEGCNYAIKRGNKIIEGPSARLAEIIAGAWGNLRIQARTTGIDEGFVYAESVAWDLESNVAISFETRRRITDKDGERYGDDMIGITGNAAVSIAFRNSLFRVVPRVYVNEIWHAARKTAAGDIQTLKQRRTEMFQFFKTQGITERQILEILNVRQTDDINLDHLLTLRGIALSMKDGIASANEIFGDESKTEQPEENKSQDVPGDITEGEAEDLESKKAGLINQIISALPQEKGFGADAKRLKILKKVFGRTVIDDISKLPVQILEAGLKALQGSDTSSE